MPADCLIQPASQQRLYEHVPASAWEAILSFIRDLPDTVRLVDSARNRLLIRYSLPLYRHAAETGSGYAAWRLVDLLADRGDQDEALQVMHARDDAGNQYGAWRMTAPSLRVLRVRGLSPLGPGLLDGEFCAGSASGCTGQAVCPTRYRWDSHHCPLESESAHANLAKVAR